MRKSQAKTTMPRDCLSSSLQSQRWQHRVKDMAGTECDISLHSLSIYIYIYIYNIMYTQEADFLGRYKAVTHKICMDPSIQTSLITPWKWRIQIRLNNLNICIPFVKSNGREITSATHDFFQCSLHSRDSECNDYFSS